MPNATRISGAFAGMINANSHAVASMPSSSGRRRTVEKTTSQKTVTNSVISSIGAKYSRPMKKHASGLSAL